MMPNYYYDAPPDFTPDETVTFEVVMPQPEEEVEVDNVTFAGSHSGDDKSWAVFRYKDDLSISVELPYPLGARVGVRETYIDLPYKVKAVRHWYTVTAVDVVQRKGQWVEKVTMRRVP